METRCSMKERPAPDKRRQLTLNGSGWLFILLLFAAGQSGALAQTARVVRGRVEVSGGEKLYYEMAGRGPSVVLIHGGLADSRMWDDQFKAFARHYRTLRYDLRGFGKSDFSMGPLSHVEDLAALLKFLRIEKATLIGLSLGGMIAMDFALEHPAMVERLVLVASGLRGYQGVKNEKGLAAYKAAEMEGREKAIALWLEHPFFVTGKNNPSYQQRMREMLTDNFRTWGPTPAPIVWNWPTRPVIERLQTIKAPTLVIVGDRDFSNITAIADILATKIPGAQRAVMTNVSHHLNMENPAEFNQLVLKFLRRK